ncbi:MAG: alpha-1,6-glucosidase domain-containing protein [Rubrivivax sp.]
MKPDTGPTGPLSTLLRWARRASLALGAAVLLTACGGGGGGGGDTPAPTPPVVVDPSLAQGNATALATTLSAVPTDADGGGSSGNTDVVATSLTVHYQRADGDYTGWQLHTWGAGTDPGWNVGHNPVRIDSFGAVYTVPLASTSGNVGYLFHKGETKDHGGTDQSYTLKAGANEIWRKEGDNVTYNANPAGATAPDITTVRVHYKRFGGDYSGWGLHLWEGSGIDTSRLAGLTLNDWGNAVPLSSMPGYAAGAGEVVFDIPVLNPQGDANRAAVEFIVHGRAPNQDNKDGRPNNIRVDFAGLKIVNRVAEVWLVQEDATLYSAAPDLRLSSLSDSRAVWLNKQLIKWPRIDTSLTVKLYHSATGQIKAKRDTVVSGADGALTLEPFTGTVPAAAAERFKWLSPGAVFALKAADQAQLGTLLKSQLVLVQEDASGKVQNATTTQTPGALDDLYAAAANVNDLGVTLGSASTTFKLWAPTAQKVRVFTYDTPTGDAVTVDEMAFDTATGVWSATRSANLAGKHYRFAVEVFVRGVGVVRNLVTDPYSLSLTTDSARSYIADLNAPALKPAGWDASTAPAKVAAMPDMSVYELHVRDFSANDNSVSAANRGKYLAFTEAGSNGMKHLKGLADAGLTDVHLLPVFDIASVPERGCASPVVPVAAADSESQQLAVAATASGDCFNWGYDPWHFTAPEGSYATDAADGAKRVLEFRAMVKALHDAGLRVGMDVVYNHTTASGQNTKSVLDRIVPGYYHRLNAAGKVETSTCCDNTATEHLMMGKLMSDSVLTWARDYKISSFRFDIMGHQPRSVMEAMKARLKTTLGRDVQFIGEGWNFGEVADGARFVQATLYSLNGSGIASFNPIIRDAVRGGSPFDSGNALVSNQGFINGLHVDPNALSAGRSRTDLMWLGDQLKATLAGSLRSYSFTTHWDEQKTAEGLGNFIGWSTQPDEVVNYVENHDNQTLFDNNAFKLPAGTSREDRARVQHLGSAITVFAQGVPYFHAGQEVLRSKSLDRNSYDAGDWFNRLDWTYTDNFFGIGVPMARENSSNWSVMKPVLANTAIKPAPGDIAWTRDAFRDLLKIRTSSTLFRLRTGDDIRQRLVFHNTGSGQVAPVLVGQLLGSGYAGANFAEVLYFVNVDPQAQTLVLPALKGKAYELHPVHQAAGAADARARGSNYSAASGTFVVPARTAVVYVLR